MPLWENVIISMPVFEHIWGKVFKTIDITNGLEKVHVPIFLALGRFDYIVAPPSSWDPLRSNFHNLTVRVFGKSGHTPQFEEPENYDATLLSGLSENS